MTRPEAKPTDESHSLSVRSPYEITRTDPPRGATRDEILAQIRQSPSWREQLRALAKAVGKTVVDGTAERVAKIPGLTITADLLRLYRHVQAELDQLRGKRFQETMVDAMIEMAAQQAATKDDVDRIAEAVAGGFVKLQEFLINDHGNLLASQAERYAAQSSHPDIIEALAEAVASIALHSEWDRLFDEHYFFLHLIAQMTPQELRVFRSIPFTSPGEVYIPNRSILEPEAQRVAIRALSGALAQQLRIDSAQMVEGALASLLQRVLIEPSYTGPRQVRLSPTPHGERLRTYLMKRSEAE